MSDQWTDELSAYLDGELGPAEESALRAHLERCGDCRDTLLELRRVAESAPRLPDREPRRDLWPAIARAISSEGQRMGSRRLPRRLSFTLPQLLAAGVVLMLLSGAAARLVRGGGERAPQANLAAVSWASSGPYGAAITDLEQALQADRASGQLDSATVGIVEHNLAVIDTALAEARTALAADPASSYLNRHLANTMQRKLDLLREATGLAVAQT